MLVVLAAACGTSSKTKKTITTSPLASTSTTTGSAGATTASTTAKASKPTTPTTAPSAAVAAKLDSVLLVAADFPSGWTSAPPDTSSSNQDQAAEDDLNKCLGTSGREADVASKDGNTFSQGQTYQASSSVSLVGDDATYKRDIAALKSDKLTPCLKESFAKHYTQDMPPGSTVDVTEIDVPQHGDVSVGRRLTLTASGNGQTVKVYVDLLLMGRHRYEVLETFLGYNTPFDTTLEHSLADKDGHRADAL